MGILAKLNKSLAQLIERNIQILQTIQENSKAETKLQSKIMAIENQNRVLKIITNSLTDTMSDEDILIKLHLLQKVRFKQKKDPGFFPSAIPSSLLTLALPELSMDIKTNPTNLLPLKYDEGLYNLLTDAQLLLLEIFDTRLFHLYECVTTYDEKLINDSTILLNYQETSKDSKYNDGSLVIDLHRGISFIEPGKSPVNMGEKLMKMQKKFLTLNKLKNDKEQELYENKNLLLELETKLKNAPSLVGKKQLTQEEIGNLEEDIAELRFSIEENKQTIQTYQNEITELQPWVEEPMRFIEQLVGGDKKKADTLNRFGHQMIPAELMREFQKAFQVNENPNSSLSPLVEQGDARISNVIRDKDGNIYVEYKLKFSVVQQDSSLYGILSANKRDIEWVDFERAFQSKEALVELFGQVQLIPDPGRKGEYCMKIKEFQVTCHSPAIGPRNEFISEKNIKIEENKISPTIEEFKPTALQY